MVKSKTFQGFLKYFRRRAISLIIASKRNIPVKTQLEICINPAFNRQVLVKDKYVVLVNIN